MTDTKLLDDLRTHQFECDAPHMVLAKKDIQSPEEHRGSGRVYQEGDGSLAFTMYVRSRRPLFLLFGDQATKAGQVIPAHEFYKLAVTDASGHEWSCDHVLWPKTTTTLTGAGWVTLTGSLPDFRRGEELPSTIDRTSLRWHLGLYFHHDIDLPCSIGTEYKTIVAGRERRHSAKRNRAEFQSCETEFELTKERDGVVLVAAGKQEEMPPHFDERILEALGFVLARRPRWRLLKKSALGSTTTVISGHPSDSGVTRAHAPLEHPSYEGYEIYNMFDRYLSYIRSHTAEDWHPLSPTVYSVIEAGEASIEAQALTLGVAVEALLRILFPQLAAEQTASPEEVNRTKRLIRDSDLQDRTKVRLFGFLGRLTQISAAEKLRALAEKGIATSPEVEAWRKLRNTWAHADHPGAWPFQQLVDYCGIVATLLHKLVFQAIGYEGPYTDYGERGWPTKTFRPSTQIPSRPPA